jgi:2-keto-4-pentenoate hydratase
MDAVAINVGSHRYIMGEARSSGSGAPDVDAMEMALSRNGRLLHRARGSEANGGQWETLRKLINQLVSQGYTLRRGDLMITGALGAVQPGEAGKYEADYGEWGRITFEIAGDSPSANSP